MEANNEKSEALVPVKAAAPALILLGVLSVSCRSAMAQTSISMAEIEKLESIVNQQQRALEQQQAQIQALQSALAEQKVMMTRIMRTETRGDTLNPATDPKPDNHQQTLTESFRDLTSHLGARGI